MEIKLYKRVFLTPFLRLTFTNSGVSISFGHRSVGWLTFGKRGLTETIDTPISGVYATDKQSWRQIFKALRLRK